MAGAISALNVGAVLLDRDGRIIACCQRFADLARRPIPELLGTTGRDLVHPRDQPIAGWLAERSPEGNRGYTIVTRSRESDDQLFECEVIRLHAESEQLVLSIVRPFGCRVRSVAQGDMALSAGNYAADMGKQLARLAAKAAMPVTCDLFTAAALSAEEEGGLGHVEETAA